jgi:hypothetical protein
MKEIRDKRRRDKDEELNKEKKRKTNQKWIEKGANDKEWK